MASALERLEETSTLASLINLLVHDKITLSFALNISTLAYFFSKFNH